MTNAPTATTYAITALWHETPVVLDTRDRWTPANPLIGMAPKMFGTYAEAEARAARLMNGGTRATAIRIIGQ